MAFKYHYIKERHNPQFEKPYYTACGLLTKSEAKRLEKAIYGHNIMLSYRTAEEYQAAIKRFEKDGFNVHLNYFT